MPRRSLLSAEQRTRLFAVPTAPAEMARHYVLSPEDLLLVRAKRRAFNRLGFAVQLCLLRHPRQGLSPGQHPPAAMLGFVAAQLGILSAVFADYARRDQTRREHAIELQVLLGLRSFRLGDWRDCLRVGADAAWATDRGEPIVQAMLAHVRAHGVLVPDAAVLERIGLAARARARQRTFQVLTDGVTEAEQAALDGLLVTDPAIRRSRSTWLRDAPEAPAPGNMVALLDRLPTSPRSAGSTSHSLGITTGTLRDPRTGCARSGPFPRRSPFAPLSVHFRTNGQVTPYTGPPASIGNLRGLGLVAAQVQCAGVNCWNRARITFEALGLGDDDNLLDVPRLRQFRCSRCGCRQVRVSPEWREHVAHGNGRQPVSDIPT